MNLTWEQLEKFITEALSEEPILNEGGNIFGSRTESIPREYIQPTLDKYYNELKKLFPKHKDVFDTFEPVGSVGKKSMSGDIDLAIDLKQMFATGEVDSEELRSWNIDPKQFQTTFLKYKKRARSRSDEQIAWRAFLTELANYINEASNLIAVDLKKITPGTMFTLFPQINEIGEEQGIGVQIDWMIGNFDWLTFSYFSDYETEDEPLIKGLHRTQLLLALFIVKNHSFSHTEGVKNKETGKLVATSPRAALKLLSQLYNAPIEHKDTDNFNSLYNWMVTSLSNTDKDTVIDSYLKVLDFTKSAKFKDPETGGIADCGYIPKVLEDYWILNKRRLNLSGKYICRQSNEKLWNAMQDVMTEKQDWGEFEPVPSKRGTMDKTEPEVEKDTMALADPAKGGGELQTVGHILDLMKMGRDQAEEMRRSKEMKKMVKATLGPIPVIGNVVALGDFFKYLGRTMIKRDVKPDEVEQYPILDLLSVDPELVATIEDDLLNALAEKYYQELNKIADKNRDTPIEKVMSINDYLRSEITKQSGKKVTVTDTSGTAQRQAGVAAAGAAGQKKKFDFKGAVQKALGHTGAYEEALITKEHRLLEEQTTILPTNKVGRVIYDPQGVGSVPDGTNVDYMGFTVWIKTNEFLRLNPERGDESEYLAKHFQTEGDVAIAPPWVGAEYIGDEENPTSNGYWKIDGHEGRGRMIEVEKINPNSLVPVHIFPRNGLRARHLTQEMIFAPIEADRRSGSSLRVQPSTIIWQGEVFKK